MICLNQGQSKVVAEAIDWAKHSSKQVFEFDGEAGTGKSVVLNEFVRQLGLQPYQYMPMAYTGQAAIIMRMKGFLNAKSIHSSLYHVVEKERRYETTPFTKMNTQFNLPEKERVFEEIPAGCLDPNVLFFIIDEGYMVPDTMLNTILKHGKKVIVAGDSGQLPPIGGAPAFLTGYGIHHLDELMRQSANNPIIYLAQRARKGLPIHNGLYGNRVLVINEDELTNEMILQIGNVICGTNKTRDFINNRTRQLLGYQTPYPQFGERIICRNNNWNIEMDSIALANGLSGVVSSPYSVSSFNNKAISIDFLPDLLNTPFRNVPIDTEYIRAPYDIRNQIKNRRFNNGELFEFAYAITTHLSQGAEFPIGIYFEEFLRSNIQNQLNYTGITRFKEYMIYVKRTKKFY